MNASPPTSPPREAPSDLRTFLGVLWRRRWLLLGIVVVATAGTYLLSKVATKQYSASVQLQLQAQNADASLFGTGDPTLDLTQNLAGAARTVTTPRVAARAARKLGVAPRSSQALLGKIRVSTDQDAAFLVVTAKDPSARRAADIANAFASALIDARAARGRSQIDQALAQLRQQLAALPPFDARGRQGLSVQIQRLAGLRAAQGDNAQIVQPAVVPKAPTSPRPGRNAVLAFIVALLVGTGLAFLLDRLDRRLRDTEELTMLTGAPLLGEVPPAAFADGAGSQPVVVEAFQMLRANLTYFEMDRQLKVIVVASPMKGDGKTTVATNLARAVAQTGKEVVLVDTDLRHPKVGARMGASRELGLGSVLTGEHDIDDVVGKTEMGGGSLRILPSGQPPPNPAALIASDRMRALLAKLADESDLVIIDTPPMLFVSDAIPLLEQASGIIFVARLGWTTHDAIRRVAEVIANTRGTLLGEVVTNAKPAVLYGYEAYQEQAAGTLAPNGQVPQSGARSAPRRWLRELRTRR